MLGASALVAFVATTDLARAAGFYEKALGLRRLDASPMAVVFDAGGTALRVTLVDELAPAPYTVLGWSVDDIATTVGGLTEAGVGFERFPGMVQDELGIWGAPGGDRVAWFRDPDGNVLSLTEPASAP